MENIIKVNHLRKSYRGQEAVKGIDFTVKRGECFALLGPNGAGKSTTINILCTCLKPDEGQVTIDGLILGRRDYEIRKRIGVVFQSGVLDEVLTVEENLYTRGRFYGLKKQELHQRIEKVVKMTGVSDLLNRNYGKLSGGQKRRCDIARALLHYPKILLLDEPTTGLDPEMRSAIWDTIDSIKKETGMTLLLTTHYMEEAARAEHIVIMKNGRIALSGTPTTLKRDFSSDSLLLLSNTCESIKLILNRKEIPCYLRKEGVVVPLSSTLEALPILDLCKGRYTGFEVQRGSMDDAYLSVIERNDNDV